MRGIARSSAIVLVCSSLLPVSSGWARKRSEQETSYYYEVWGTGTKEPNRQRPWSEPYDTEEEAQARLEEIERDHAKGGLLETDPDHPLDLKVKKVPYKKSSRPVEPEDKTKPVDPVMSGPRGAIPKSVPKGTITVKVYKLVDMKWMVQPERTYEKARPTEKDYDKALDYYQKVKAIPGWNATWNAPGWPRPKEFKAAKPYNPPRASKTESKSLEGTTWKAYAVSLNGEEWTGFTWSFQRGGRIEARHKDGTVLNVYSYRVSGNKLLAKLIEIEVNGRSIPVTSTAKEEESAIEGDRIRGYHNLRKD